MKRRIAVICAFLAGRNTGMYTVDRSAFEYFSDYEGEADVSYYVLGDETGAGFPPHSLGFEYKNLKQHASEVESSDLIVFWGDFLHAWSYWETDLFQRLVHEGQASTQTEATDLAFARLLLEKAPDQVLKRVVIFGGTLITNHARQLSNQRYKAALERLLSLAAGVFFRDSISAAYAAQLRSTAPTQGTDCALLLELEDRRHAARSHQIGVFFGRANWIGRAIVFSRLLAVRRKLKPIWFPWLPSPRRHALVAWANGFGAGQPEVEPSVLLGQLRGLDAVVTDTYHLCVNAWRLGVPAVCIGRGAERINTTLGDKKKESFFAMCGASEFYVYREEILGSLGLSGGLRRASRSLANDSAIDVILENLRRQSSSARLRLTHACREVLDA